MAKKTFILNDESIFNDYGFRVLTAGIDTRRFEKNPVMLYAHTRPWEGKEEPATPIGKWENIRKEGALLLADPIFDDEGPDEFAKKISHKVEKGFLNTASVYLDIIELSEDPIYMLPGQVLPTITKSIVKEGSIADIPGNENCVSMMLSYNGQTIKLTGGADDQQELQKLFSPNKNDTSMKSLILKLNSFTGIKLTDSASEAEVYAALDKVLSDANTKASVHEQEVIKLTAERDALNTKLSEVAAQAVKDKALALVEGAISAKKITAVQRENYIKLAEGNYDVTKSLIDGMKGYESVHTKLNSGDDNSEGADDAKLAEEYEKLFKAGKLEKIKQTSPDSYKAMFKARFGKEPK